MTDIAILLGVFLIGFFINRWWVSAKRKADEFVEHMEKVNAYTQCPAPTKEDSPTLQSLKVEILQNYMYSAFDKPADAIEDMVEDNPDTEGLVNIAFGELDQDGMFGKFEGATYDLIGKIVKEHTQRYGT